jgi:hypothetical protein
MAGFAFRFRESGSAPTIRKLYAKDDETLTKGDIINVETGEADLAVSGDTALIGGCVETKAHTDSTTQTEVIVDDDAVYGVVDANARKIGATLDLSGATGAQTVTTSSNKDFVVVCDSSATEETLVRVNPNRHALSGTAIA